MVEISGTALRFWREYLSVAQLCEVIPGGKEDFYFVPKKGALEANFHTRPDTGALVSTIFRALGAGVYTRNVDDQRAYMEISVDRFDPGKIAPPDRMDNNVLTTLASRLAACSTSTAIAISAFSPSYTLAEIGGNGVAEAVKIALLSHAARDPEVGDSGLLPDYTSDMAANLLKPGAKISLFDIARLTDWQTARNKNIDRYKLPSYSFAGLNKVKEHLADLHRLTTAINSGEALELKDRFFLHECCNRLYATDIREPVKGLVQTLKAAEFLSRGGQTRLHQSLYDAASGADGLSNIISVPYSNIRNMALGYFFNTATELSKTPGQPGSASFLFNAPQVKILKHSGRTSFFLGAKVPSGINPEDVVREYNRRQVVITQQFAWFPAGGQTVVAMVRGRSDPKIISFDSETKAGEKLAEMGEANLPIWQLPKTPDRTIPAPADTGRV